MLVASSRGEVGGGVGGASRSSVAFLHPTGSKRRLQLQVVRLAAATLKRSASNPSFHGGESHSPADAGAASAGVSLFVVCHDLSDALRQAEREIEQKAHRVLNHTAKRVMANTSQVTADLPESPPFFYLSA